MGAQLAVDIGGTFTDVVLEFSGRRVSTKVLTTHQAPEKAVVQGVVSLLTGSEIKPNEVDRFIHGTTLATNALIERKGAVTALITTAGFRDSLEIGYEHRFEQYDVFMQKPEPLVSRDLRFEIAERITAKGEVLISPRVDDLVALVAQLREAGISSVAVVFLHSFTNPVNELAVRDELTKLMPELSICLSHEVCPEIREYERLCTTVANAYVRPVMSSYLERLKQRLGQDVGINLPVMLMTSGGGLTDIDTAKRFPVRLVESGPAGGVIMANQVAHQHGVSRTVAFDMGGTTAKLCLIDDGKPLEARLFEVARAYRFKKGSGIPIRIPVIELVEIGAGGGSIAKVDAMQRILVGPESAGSEPGPACFGKGTQPTVTDADLVLGRLQSDHFGDGSVSLSPVAAQTAIEQYIGTPLSLGVELAALGISEIVDEAMASAGRVHAIERGAELTGRTLVATGGAAPLHAARLAQKLGIQQVIVPRDAGVGSAVGFLRAPVSFSLARSRYMRFSDLDVVSLNAFIQGMQTDALKYVAHLAGNKKIRCRRFVDARYVGQGHEVQVTLPDDALLPDDVDRLKDAFEVTYRRYFSRTIPNQEIEFLNWLVVVSVDTNDMESAPVLSANTEGAQLATPLKSRPLFDPARGEWHSAGIYLRDQIANGQHGVGPALIIETQTTTVVPADFSFYCAENGDLVLKENE